MKCYETMSEKERKKIVQDRRDWAWLDSSFEKIREDFVRSLRRTYNEIEKKDAEEQNFQE